MQDANLGIQSVPNAGLTAKRQSSPWNCSVRELTAENWDAKWVQSEMKERCRGFRGNSDVPHSPTFNWRVVELLLHIQGRQNDQKVKQEGGLGGRRRRRKW